ncbi:MAG: hypothetical protein WCW02_01145 [Candidatus Buchananbacteria bacterium]
MAKKTNNELPINKLIESRQVEILAEEDLIIHEGLKQVYADGNGILPDLSKIEKKQTSWWFSSLVWTVIILAVLTAISWLMFFWWSNGNEKFSGKNVSVKISGPLVISPGQATDYSLIITNQEQVDIYNLNLELNYPENFVLASSTPEPFSESQTNFWKFAVLKSGQSQKIDFKGITWADKNSTQNLSASLKFRPANFNADFKAENVLELNVGVGAVSLVLSGSDKILPEQPAAYSLKFKNNSSETLKDLQLVVIPPAAYVLKQASVEAEKDQTGLWLIKQLKAGEEGEVKISGNYEASKLIGPQEFKAQIKLKGPADNYFVLDEQVIDLTVVKDQVSLDLVINNSAQNQVINFGETLNYVISFNNNNQTALDNLELSLKLDSQILDWSSLKDSNQGKITDNVITWTSKEIKNLVTLAGGQGSSLKLVIKVKDNSVINDPKVTNFGVKSQATLSFKSADGSVNSVVSQELSEEVNSDASISAVGRYFTADGTAVGSGPLPPKAGQTTTYQIGWQINNSLHELADLKFVITLPAGITWANHTDLEAGSLVYNASNRSVTWSINRLPKTVRKISATFNVSVTPVASQRGKLLTLIPESSLTTTDKQTGAQLNLTAPAVTTDLVNDVNAAGKGIVE